MFKIVLHFAHSETTLRILQKIIKFNDKPGITALVSVRSLKSFASDYLTR